jgi:hypothetical protein
LSGDPRLDWEATIGSPAKLRGGSDLRSWGSRVVVISNLGPDAKLLDDMSVGGE